MSQPEYPPAQPGTTPAAPTQQQAQVPPHPQYSPAGAGQPLVQGYQAPQDPSGGPQQGANQQPAPSFYNPQGTPKPSKKLLWIGLGGGFVAGVLATVIVAATGALAGSGPSFKSAAETCGTSNTAGVSVGDKGASITIDTKGEDDKSGAAFDDASCILTELNVPDHVISQMDDTSSMDGRQAASWDGVSASWTYHPDSGMKLILTQAKE